jgi:hypothetical protein
VSPEQLSDRIIAEPTSVIFIHPRITAYTIDEVVYTESVGRGQHQQAVKVEVPTSRPEEPAEAAQVLDQLTGEHNVKRLTEVEVLGVSEHHVVPTLPD